MNSASMRRVWDLMGRYRRYAWIPLLAVTILLSVAVVPYVLNSPGENESVVRAGSGTFSLTPDNLYYIGSPFAHINSEITGQLSTNFTGEVTVCTQSSPACLNGTSGVLSKEKVQNVGYFAIYFPSQNLHAGQDPVTLFLNSTPTAHFTVTVAPSNDIYLLDAAALAIPLLYTAGIYFAPVRPRVMVAAAIPAYLVFAALFGQRYDVFFMISSGIRLVNHVNPYVASPAVPNYLEWIYPPLFVGYSAIVAVGSGALFGTGVPTNASLNYAGALVGDQYDAWRAIVGPNLPEYYLLIKLPMIAATIATYYLLRDKFKQGRAEKLWLLNPFVIFIGVVWGQLDVMAALCMGLSIFHLSKGETFHASIFASLGAAIKVFPALLLPFILISSRNKSKDLLPVAGAAAAIMGFYAYSGNVTGDLFAVLGTGSSPNMEGAYYANGITWQTLIPFAHFPSLFVWIFVPFYAYQIVRYLRSRRDLTHIMIECFLVFYLTYNLANPQYFIYVVLLFLIANDIKNALIFSAIPAIDHLLPNDIPYFTNPAYSYNYFASPMGQAAQFQNALVGALHIGAILVVVASGIYLYTFLRTEVAHGLAQDFRRALRIQGH